MKAKKRGCECGGEMVLDRRDYKFLESGLDNVLLKDIEVWQCARCASAIPRIPRHNDLMNTIAVALIVKPYPLGGQEIRFLRKFVGKTQEEFAKLVPADKASFSRWETDAEQIGPKSDRLIRVIALALGDGLKEKLADMIEVFGHMHKKPKNKVNVAIKPETDEYEYLVAA